MAAALAVLALAASPPRAGASGCTLGATADATRPSEVLPVTKRRSFVVPGRATDRALVFAPFQVMRYRSGWTASRSRTRTSGAGSELEGESRRSFSFALEEPGAPALEVECEQRAHAEDAAEPGRLVVDQELRCRISGAGASWALDLVDGRGTLAGTAGVRYEVRLGDALGSGRARPPACAGFVVREAGVPVLAFAPGGKGRFELAPGLPAEARRLLAAAGSALALAEIDAR